MNPRLTSMPIASPLPVPHDSVRTADGPALVAVVQHGHALTG
ncbi:hypothetical protein [Streptomyces sp. NPDC093071]